jgi:hypothetical protein
MSLSAAIIEENLEYYLVSVLEYSMLKNQPDKLHNKLHELTIICKLYLYLYKQNKENSTLARVSTCVLVVRSAYTEFFSFIPVN